MRPLGGWRLAPLALALAGGEEDPRQIHWIPSLEAAQALAERTGRPLLLAVNMDGESASDRIVVERYRDPEFVAWTRPFVCIVASVFRHAPRDFDAEGARIPCPRLGSVSCAEHIALEPVLFERYLGGQRISPRHAVVLPGGEKAFDLFLLHDLRELDRALADQAAKVEGGPIPLAEIEKARAPFHPPSLELDLLAWGRPERRPERLSALVRRDGSSGRARSLLLSFAVAGDRAAREAALGLLDEVFGDEISEKIRGAIAGVDVPEGDVAALRELGDAEARLLAERSGKDPVVEVAGLARSFRAFAAAADSPEAEDADWHRLGAWYGALGRRREEAETAREGLARFPESAALHGLLGNAYRDGGFFAEASAEAEAIARENPESATCAWYAGYARIFEAEAARRARDAAAAIAAYDAAQGFFETSRTLRPDFAETAGHYVAMASLGRAFAHLLANRRREAMASLADAVAERPAIAEAKDGLGGDVLDLVDGILEWRESGPSPVDPRVLGESLTSVDPANALWWRQVSDTALREALRAEGRGEPEEGMRWLRASVDAGRRALEIASGDLERRVFAQAATTLAERLLDAGDAASARPLLTESSSVVRNPTQVSETRDLARALREILGEARPIPRPGR